MQFLNKEIEYIREQEYRFKKPKRIDSFEEFEEYLSVPLEEHFFVDTKSKNRWYKKQNESIYFILRSNCLDTKRFIDKFKLQLSKKNIERLNGNLRTWEKYKHEDMYLPKNGEFFVSLFSMYGNYFVIAVVNEYVLRIDISPKSKNFSKYVNTYKKTDFINPNDVVVLDIETTGFNPLLDDVIEMAFFDIETEKNIQRYLPLTKRKEIPNQIIELTKISKKDIDSAKPLSSDEINKIFKDFNLENKYILIWTGENQFDAQFLSILFSGADKNIMSKLKFIIAPSLLEKNNVFMTGSYSKDYLAKLIGLDLTNSHNALGDCLLEAQIYKKAFDIKTKNKNDINDANIDELKLYRNIISFLLTPNTKKISDMESIYWEFVDLLKKKNRNVMRDYDDNPLTRGSEWIDIHHVDELCIDNIAVKTNKAIKENDRDVLLELKAYNKKERLVYCNKIEHFLLHCFIEYIRPGLGGGPHYLFGDLLRMNYSYNLDQKNIQIKSKMNSFYTYISFEQVVDIYAVLLENKKLKLIDVFSFYKIDERDIKTFNPTIEKINSFLQKTNLF